MEKKHTNITTPILIMLIISFAISREVLAVSEYANIYPIIKPTTNHHTYIADNNNSRGEYSINYPITSKTIIDPFLGTNIDIDDISPDYSFSAPEYSYTETKPYDYQLNAGIKYKLSNIISMSLNPRNNRLKTEFILGKADKFGKIKIRLNRKKAKAVYSYRW